MEEWLAYPYCRGSLAHNHNSNNLFAALGYDLFVSRGWFPWQQQLARAFTFPPLQWWNAAGKAKEESLGPESLKELFCNHDVSFSDCV